MPDHANPSAAAPSIDGARTTRLRIDRWLCNARFFKTRGLAVAAIENGRIDINGVRAKAAKWVTTGDFLRIQRPPYVQEVEVLDAVARRVGASIAQGLYRETAASVAARTAQQEHSALSRIVEEPRQGKLDKHDRRDRERLKRSCE